MNKMPLVEYLTSCYPDISLHRMLFICSQHILATTHSMFRSLYAFGLNPRNIFVLGKCYSTNRDVWHEMQADGIRVCPGSFFFESHESFDVQFQRISESFLESVLHQIDPADFERIIIMDDGGQLLTLATKFFSGHKNIIGIEQTSSGYEKIKKNLPSFPVIDVARSYAKLHYESPIIAEAVSRKVWQRILKLNRIPSKILIIGMGAIGSSLYNVFKEVYKNSGIFGYDQNGWGGASESGICKDNFDDSLRQFDLIVGCTGSVSIPAAKHRFLKSDCMLVSASSSDREFDAMHLRRRCKSSSRCHNDFICDELILLNSGFPVNFTGGRHSVAPSKIQLTRALLVAAIFQASEFIEFTPGIVPLDGEMQRDILTKFFSLHPKLEAKANSISVQWDAFF